MRSIKQQGVQHGVGLTELMISLLLSSLIIITLMHQYLGIKQHYQKSHQLLDRDIEVQLVTNLMRHSIRHAGFTPCGHIESLAVLEDADNALSFPSIYISSGKKPFLSIQRMDEKYGVVKSIVSDNEFIVNKLHVITHDKIFIADCLHAEIQTVKKVQSIPQGQKITLSQPFNFRYQSPVYVGKWLRETFFIQQKGDSKALFYQYHRVDKLTEYVTGLQVNYRDVHDKSLVDVILRLDNDKTHHFETFVRN